MTVFSTSVGLHISFRVVQHRTQEHRSNNVHLVLVIIMWGECVWLDCIIITVSILCPHAWFGKGTHKTTVCARNVCLEDSISVPQYTTIVV